MSLPDPHRSTADLISTRITEAEASGECDSRSAAMARQMVSMHRTTVHRYQVLLLTLIVGRCDECGLTDGDACETLRAIAATWGCEIR